MKKLALLLIALSVAFTLSAQEVPGQIYSGHWEGPPHEEGAEHHEEAVAAHEEAAPHEAEEEAAEHKRIRIPNRGFETGLFNTSIGVSNNFLSLDEIFSKTVVIDLKNLEEGLRFDFGIDLRPVSFFINKDKWGVGLDIARITAFGNIDLSGNLINFKKTEKEGDKFGAGAAVFVDVGAPFFFHLNKLNGFKISARPAFYAPLIYLEPNMSFKYTDNSKGANVGIEYTLQPYSIVTMDPDSKNIQPEFTMGFDFSASTEYPLFRWLDLGVDITNIPFIPGSLSNYMKMKGKVKADTSKLSFEKKDEDDDDDIFKDIVDSDISDTVYGSNQLYILRPFKMVFYANYRPFESVQSFTVIPRLGFAVNALYAEPGSIEAGFYARYDLINLLIVTIGMNYTDRMWKNSVDVAFNLRAFEIDLGVALQSPDFAKAWEGAGLGVNFGLKFGW